MNAQGYLGLEGTERLESFFHNEVAPHLSPVILKTDLHAPFLINNLLYLVAELWPADDDQTFGTFEPSYGIVGIPTKAAGRFVESGGDQSSKEVVFLDDVIRLYIDSVFPGYDVGGVFSIKVTRDAQLYLESEFSGDVVELISKGLKNRDRGAPTRLLYDPRMPYPMVTALIRYFDLSDDDLVLGGVYHNFSDFFSFPDFGRVDLRYEPWPTASHPAVTGLGPTDYWETIRAKDQVIHFPYQSYQLVLDFFAHAVSDPAVESICVTLYRVASDSRVVAALLDAARLGKQVTAFVEVKARFDEAPNISWAREMEAAGVNVLYSRPELKVHSKIALVVRQTENGSEQFAYLSTGNFNEKSARVYSDIGLFTADPRLTRDVRSVFKSLADREEHEYDHLLVAPHQLRKELNSKIDREIENAGKGLPSGIMLKMNSIEDPRMIRRLYEASAAGVEIRLIVRGICRLVPGLPDLSESIVITPIIDRYLEHARVYRFTNAGEPEYYLSSADWMRRNLNRRVEVAFPIYDRDVKRQIERLLQIQLGDSRTARLIDATQSNAYVAPGETSIRAQETTYHSIQRGELG